MDDALETDGFPGWRNALAKLNEAADHANNVLRGKSEQSWNRSALDSLRDIVQKAETS